MALKSGEWLLRGLRLMTSSLANIVGRKSRVVIFYPLVQIPGICFVLPFRDDEIQKLKNFIAYVGVANKVVAIYFQRLRELACWLSATDFCGREYETN